MGSSLKMPRGSLSPLRMQTVPLAMCGIAHSPRTKILTHSTRMSRIRNSSPPAFHPDVSHPEFFSVDIPSGCLASGILLRRHSIRVSRIRNSSPPTFHLGVSHPEFFSADIPIWMSRIRNSVRPTFHLFRMSHIRNSIRPTFHLLRMSLIRNFVRPTFNLLRISHVQRLTPDGRGDDSTSPVRHVRILIL